MIAKSLNWWCGYLQTAVGVSDTNIEIDAGAAARLSAVMDGNTVSPAFMANAAAREVVYIIGISGNIITVERAKEGGVALIYQAGHTIEISHTADLHDYFVQKGDPENQFSYKTSRAKIVDHGILPGQENSIAVAGQQSPAGSGNLTLSLFPYQPPNSVPRKPTVTSDSDSSGITLTFSYKDENGESQTGAISGPNAETLEADFYFSEISQIAVSGAAANVSVGIGEGFVVLSPENGELQKLGLDAPIRIEWGELPSGVRSGIELHLRNGGSYPIDWPVLQSEYGAFPILSENLDILTIVFSGTDHLVFHSGRNMQ
ncbi:MAG: hypothetical protein GY749_06930 [Desulfobacteraceae bacterium]|nr:hypothetical protein [Desulfobacteraceae bacterium]